MDYEAILRRLSKDEATCLYWVFKDLTYPQIEEKTNIGRFTVQQLMSGIYRRLKAPGTTAADKRRFLDEEHIFDIFLRLIENDPKNIENFPLPPREVIETTPVQKPLEAPVVDLEPSMEQTPISTPAVEPGVDTPSKPIDQLPKAEAKPVDRPKPTPQPHRRPSWIAPLLGGAFLTCILVIALASLLLQNGIISLGFPPMDTPTFATEPAVTLDTPTFATEPAFTPATATVALESPTTAFETPSQVVPTEDTVATFVAQTLAALVPPTQAGPVQNTPVPTDPPTLITPPADGILFQDTFDAALKPEWTQISGTWIVSNGRLTKLPDPDYKNSYEWITLNSPHWKNYIVSVVINKPRNDDLVIAVRNNTSNNQLIGLNVNLREEINLVLIEETYLQNTLIIGESDIGLPFSSDVNIELEVQGETYVLRSSGREVQRTTFPGYDSGGVSIGLRCNDEDDGCTTFENFKVTYLP